MALKPFVQFLILGYHGFNEKHDNVYLGHLLFKGEGGGGVRSTLLHLKNLEQLRANHKNNTRGNTELS